MRNKGDFNLIKASTATGVSGL